jgi:mono/diheme cytochrome c family protein
MHTRAVQLTALSGLALLAALAGACRGDRSDKPPRQFLPDMDQQPKLKAQSGTEFFADGRTARLPDANAVAFGTADFDPTAQAGQTWAAEFLRERSNLLAADDAHALGVDPNGPEGWAAFMPVAVTPELIERGRERFNISCVACHGYMGDGKGTVGLRWAYPPANIAGGVYLDRTQKQGTDGWIYHVIREGVWGPDGANKMPGYAHALDPDDAWAVVAYLRTLQASQNARIEDVPDDAARRLRGSAPAPAAAPAPAPAPAPTPASTDTPASPDTTGGTP